MGFTPGSKLRGVDRLNENGKLKNMKAEEKWS